MCAGVVSRGFQCWGFFSESFPRSPPIQIGGGGDLFELFLWVTKEKYRASKHGCINLLLK